MNSVVQIGPYALWTVPADWGGDPVPSGDNDAVPFDGELEWVEIGPIKRGRRQVLQYCWVPNGPRRRGGPKNVVGEVTPHDARVVDLRAADPAAEVAAFAKVYAAELAELAELYGSPPELGWGWVGWECNY